MNLVHFWNFLRLLSCLLPEPCKFGLLPEFNSPLSPNVASLRKLLNEMTSSSSRMLPILSSMVFLKPRQG